MGPLAGIGVVTVISFGVGFVGMVVGTPFGIPEVGYWVGFSVGTVGLAALLGGGE